MAINMLNLRFGRLLVIADAGSIKHSPTSSHKLWKCLCDCGKEFTTYGSSLRTGKSVSCGCYHAEKMREVVETSVKKHGLSGTKVYDAWNQLRQRCDNPNNEWYSSYGGRGIAYDDSWNIFDNFYRDMGDPPTVEHSIGRIDNDGNYCKSNCQWELPVQQQNNKRNNNNLTFSGETKTLSEWAVSLGIPRATLNSRIRSGWSHDEAISGRRT
jgi:hypothetical protein